MESLVVQSRADDPALARAAVAVEQAAWVQLGFLNFTRAHYAYYDDLLGYFSDYQLCLVSEASGYVVAAANSVPFYWDEPGNLPEEGWDWIVETAHRTRNREPNMIGGLAMSIPAVHRAQGLGRIMIKAMKELARQRGLRGPVMPVRPSLKAKHPFVPIDDYLRWRDDDGHLYDPWLRSHASMGGRIVRPCRRSMVVEEPIGFWETWANRRFEESGAFAVDGGLVPIEIDVERGIGRYAEPNVWFSYA